MKKLKILLATETYPPDINGAALFVESLAKSLAEKGHHVFLIAPSPEFKDKIEKHKNLKIFRMQTIPLKPLHPYFRVIVKFDLKSSVEKIIQTIKPDIIHIHNHFLLGRLCAQIGKKRNIPVIGTNHFMPENLLEYVPKISTKKVRTYMWKDFLRVFNNIDLVTSPSQAGAKMLKDLGLKPPLKIISNGINLEKFSHQKVQEQFIQHYKINSNIPILLFVGRLEKDKNLDIVIKAFAKLRKKTPARLIIVGKGRDESSFKKLATVLKLQNEITFTGKIPFKDLEQFYSVANVYIGSGSAELQGLAVMEAMANKLPILAVNAIALPELVKDGVNGYLFKLNEKSLLEKMLKIISDKETLKTMGKESYKIIKKHDRKKTIDEFEKLYFSAISNQTSVSPN